MESPDFITEAVNIYLFPEVAMFSQNEELPNSVRQGYSVNIEAYLPENQPTVDNRSSIIFTTRFKVVNKSSTKQGIPFQSQLYIAPSEAENVYASEYVRASTLLDPLAPGGTEEFLIQFIIDRSSESWELMKTGSFLTGILIHIPWSTDYSVSYRFELTDLRLQLSLFPFDFIPPYSP